MNSPVGPVIDAKPTQPVWAGWVERKMAHFMIFAVGMVLLSFNGIWRAGRDSALYRGLADSLVAGRGFTFAGEVNRHAYPGLPWLLAGLQKAFGESDIAPLLLMSLLGVFFVYLSYLLVRTAYPAWMAVVVLLGLATSPLVVQQSQELMTDMPFAFGVVLSLLAWERVSEGRCRRTQINRSRIGLTRLGWGVALALGLALAATTRPTFWVLAISFMVVGLVQSLSWGRAVSPRGRRRRRIGLVSVGVIVAAVVGLAVVDPGSILSGRYKVELFVQLGAIQSSFASGAWVVLNNDINSAFFSQTMTQPPLLFTGLLLVGTSLMMRRRPLWTLNVFLLVGVTIIVTSEARYFLAVLPIMWLGWVLLAERVTRRLRSDHRSVVIAVLLGVPMVMNLGKSLGFIFEQRRADLALFSGSQTRRDFFYSYYRNGEIPLLQQLGQAIHRRSQPYDRILSPEANMVAYFAKDRTVVGLQTRIAHRVPEAQYAKKLTDYDPTIVVFPGKLYIDSDPKVARLIYLGVIRSRRTILRHRNAEGSTLFTLDRPEFHVPDGDWRLVPPPTTLPSERASR